MKRRSGESSGSFVVMLQRYAQTIIALVMVGGLAMAGLNHFATAADVAQIKGELKAVALDARKARIEDELFKLRSDKPTRGSNAQIQRYESELRDINARLRDLQKAK